MSSRPSTGTSYPSGWRGGGTVAGRHPGHHSPFSELLPVRDRLGPGVRGAGLPLLRRLHLRFEHVLPQLLVLGTKVDGLDVLGARPEDPAGRRVVEVVVGG